MRLIVAVCVVPSAGSKLQLLTNDAQTKRYILSCSCIPSLSLSLYKIVSDFIIALLYRSIALFSASVIALSLLVIALSDQTVMIENLLNTDVCHVQRITEEGL